MSSLIPWHWLIPFAVVAVLIAVTVVVILAAGPWEKRPYRTWRRETADDPPFASPYLEEMNLQATEQGFTHDGAYRIDKTGGAVRYVAHFWTGPHRYALALVASGGAGPLRQNVTLLLSRLESGPWLLTCDDHFESDMTGLVEIHVEMNADFGELLDAHFVRLRASDVPYEPLPGPLAEEGYHEMEAARRDELVRRGLARERDDHWSLTFRGAAKMSWLSLARMLGGAQHLDRSRLKRPGQRGYERRHGHRAP
ncbi:MAG: hypothetical protein ACYTGP_11960 [Planctomycetota bacterium]|jgi:hypothetical protein